MIKITYLIIAVTVVFSLIGFMSVAFRERMIFSPYFVKRNKDYYRFLSSGFLHADLIHLLVNMYVLLHFGQKIEFGYQERFGVKGIYYYCLLYLAGIIISELPSYKKNQDNISYRSLGASGATSAVLFATIAIYPVHELYFFGIIALPGFVLAIIYLLYSAHMAKRNIGNINHDAHFYGAAFGFIYTIALKPTLIISFFNQIIDWAKDLI
jgi:membrane associated rhomboid family serine protease